MHLDFMTIAEPGVPGLKWQKLFNSRWGAYRSWFISSGAAYLPNLQSSQEALQKYMPKMWPTYRRLCKLANADEVAARFLTGYQPPAYITGCSQAALPGNHIQLIRNYDYHPDLTEGVQLLTAWNGKKVIGTGDCLIGILDGMNEDGLAVSLSFGGRKEVGEGFGIPFILRYVLEFCSNVEEAMETMCTIPSHMSYNVTVVDSEGAFKTLQIAPDRPPLVTDVAFATNHQGKVDWPEYAHFNKTLERTEKIKKILFENRLSSEEVIDSFLEPPLYNTRFDAGFGTLYTAVYSPMEGSVQLYWPNQSLMQHFDDFKEEERTIDLNKAHLDPRVHLARNAPATPPKKSPGSSGFQSKNSNQSKIIKDHPNRLKSFKDSITGREVTESASGEIKTGGTAKVSRDFWL